ncbi:hypothetical protein CEUSTIGMA_g4765.t1 [Chlamydomonas eustigma]|uniref:Cyclic nucleotide-binding domain-containing protein n=1 Tax=Chlamydomonas eustigma TaxID=1157962 RepID=A0A250X307_9CHLO|nr:hypothetical protein CEUSTIGMA_g4765.t1 [Chlamydomonas eustigma]|eukprot:GAX77319.1 hypothetical protein CEUSTIGMA_g4765.t1 [Chlamydomonas eustigma]
MCILQTSTLSYLSMVESLISIQHSLKRLVVKEEAGNLINKKPHEMGKAVTQDSSPLKSLLATTADLTNVESASTSSPSHEIKLESRASSIPHRQILRKERKNVVGHNWVILPGNRLYSLWWILTLAASFCTALLEPFVFAFMHVPGLAPYNSCVSILVFCMIAIFAVDMVINCFLAYEEPELRKTVVDREMIRRKYFRFMFWVDFIACFPWDLVVMAGLGINADPVLTGEHGDRPSVLPLYVGILKWLTLLRLYRVVQLFARHLEYNMYLGQLTVTLLRNEVYVLLLLHWGACWWYWLARVNYFSTDLLDPTWFATAPTVSSLNGTFVDDYIASFYFVLFTYATLGYGDIHPTNSSEYVFAATFVLICTVVTAYIVGTITAVVVSSDEDTSTFRQHMSNLDFYKQKHGIPKALCNSMEAHLKNHLDFADRSDEAVLNIYPSAMRRKVLRHLYLGKLSGCYLFRDCHQKLLNLIISVATIETFMPLDEVVAEGDIVQELSLLTEGQIRVTGRQPLEAALFSSEGLQPTSNLPFPLQRAPSQTEFSSYNGRKPKNAAGTNWKKIRDAGSLTTADYSISAGAAYDVSMVSGAGNLLFKSRILYQGHVFGEISFITETPSLESIVTLELCSVLVIRRETWEGIKETYPLLVCRVLERLQEHCEDSVLMHLKEQGIHHGKINEDSNAIAQMHHIIQSSAATNKKQDSLFEGVTDSHRKSIAAALGVQTHLQQFKEKVAKTKVVEFLSAVARNDQHNVQEMLASGHDVNAIDYDGRTALMIAVNKVRDDPNMVQLLLEAGADTDIKDHAGSTALLDACKCGNDSAIEALCTSLRHVDSGIVTNLLCRSVFTNDIAMLKRLLRAGAEPHLEDWDQRTALHIAAAEGRLEAVKLLLEDTQDALNVCDRWGHTPLQEAKRSGHVEVAQYLESVLKERQALQNLLIATRQKPGWASIFKT